MSEPAASVFRVYEELEGRVSLKIADGKPQGPFALPRWGVLSAGRTAGYGLHLPPRWVPNKLCRFVPFEHGWVVQVGPSPRMRVEDRYIGDHVFARRSMVALQEGKTRLSFPELDDFCELAVVIGPGAAQDFPEPRESVVEDQSRIGTEYAARRVVLTVKQRQIVATTFEHLIKGEPKPSNLAAAASAKLPGTSEQAVKNALGKVRDKVNLERWGPAIEGYDALGHYLVLLTRNVTWEDLPDYLR